MLRGNGIFSRLNRILAAAGLAWSGAWGSAAERPALHYTGKPLRIECPCTNDDISSAGLNCTDDEPCPLYLELGAVEAVGNTVFVVGNFHTATVTLYSIVLSSDDAGKTWQEPHERMRATGLEHIQFVDFENGWISGQLLQPLPQDPFFLITSDGGKTWRRRSVFEESRTGSVSQFYFSSRSNGSMVIDRGETGRFELYESPNGGETWMLREVNEKPLRIRRGAPPNTDWRIRADRASQAFWIERRQGSGWAPLAAFSVPAGACKPPAPAPPPEP